jgi:hypothetical protein
MEGVCRSASGLDGAPNPDGGAGPDGNPKHVQPMPTGRYSACAVTTSGGDILIIGGYTDSWDGRVQVGNVEAFRPSTNHWTPLADAPLKGHLGCDLGPDGRVYASDCATLIVYDQQNDSWSTVSQFAAAPPVDLEPDRPALLTGSDGRLYLIRHISNVPDAMAVSAYDLHARTWSSVASPTKMRWNFAATRDSKRIYVLGGCDTPPMTSADSFDPATGRWSSLDDLPFDVCATGAAVSTDGAIYIAGGYSYNFSSVGNNGATEAGARLSPGTAWQNLPTMPIADEGWVAAAANGTVYFFTAGRTASFDIAQGRWF